MRLRFELNPHLSVEEKFSWLKVASAFKDPKMYLHAVLEFSVTLSLFSFMTFLPAIIRGLGYTSVHAQLITVPVYIWATISYLVIAWASDRVGLRSPFILGATLACIVGYSMNISSSSLGVRLAAVFMLGTGVYATVSHTLIHPSKITRSDSLQAGLSIVWLNSNFAGHFKRATALGIVFSIGNSSGIVVGQIFTAPTARRYLMGSRITIGFAAFGMLLVVGQVLALRHVNKKREERLMARQPGAETEIPIKGFSDYDDTFRYNL